MSASHAYTQMIVRFQLTETLIAGGSAAMLITKFFDPGTGTTGWNTLAEPSDFEAFDTLGKYSGVAGQCGHAYWDDQLQGFVIIDMNC